LSVFDGYSVDIFDEHVMLKLVAVILLLESLFAVDLHDFVDDSESLLVFLREFFNPWHEFLHEALFDDSIDNL
jgi:hypothetical protein